MKIALCFSGQARSIELCIETINENIIKKCETRPDIFCHFYPTKKEERQIIEKLLSPKLYVLESEEKIG